eukprot:INCI6529.1.p3 GENE.INCI6529.1~~INCI6529.1.p3  ORF type:complete len:123 (+),score=7.10 INCI6529.1:47-415(+)
MNEGNTIPVQYSSPTVQYNSPHAHARSHATRVLACGVVPLPLHQRQAFASSKRPSSQSQCPRHSCARSCLRLPVLEHVLETLFCFVFRVFTLSLHTQRGKKAAQQQHDDGAEHVASVAHDFA